MRRASALALALCICAVLPPRTAAAGAFTLEPGETKIFATATLNSGDHYFDREGKLTSRARYRKRELQAYAEHGLFDGFTVFGATGLQKISVKGAAGDGHEGLGRSELGGRLRVYQKDGWIASLQSSGVIAGMKENDKLAAVGESDDQFDLRGLVARSFELFGKPAFVDFGAGYRFRSGDPSNEIRLDATFGIRPAPRWQLLAQSFNTLGTAEWRGPYPLKQRIYKLQGAALYDLTENLSLVGAAFFTPAGRDALDERGATLGIGLRF